MQERDNYAAYVHLVACFSGVQMNHQVSTGSTFEQHQYGARSGRRSFPMSRVRRMASVVINSGY